MHNKFSEVGFAKYEAPHIEVSTFMVEQGFQVSLSTMPDDSNTPPPYDEGGEDDWLGEEY